MDGSLRSDALQSMHWQTAGAGRRPGLRRKRDGLAGAGGGPTSPTAEVIRLREPALCYAGTREPMLLRPVTLPNNIDFGMNAPGSENPFADYFYLGVPGLLAFRC